MKFQTLALLLVCSAVSAQQVQDSGAKERALLDQYCVPCHNQKLHTAGLSLESVNVHVERHRITETPEVWDKILEKLRGGLCRLRGCRGRAMPP